MNQYFNELDAMFTAAEQASAVCRDWFNRAANLTQEERDALLNSTSKSEHYAHYGYQDAFTRADEESEKAILPILHDCLPDALIVSEESRPNCADAPDGTQRWVVDPLDGTSRFKNGLPDFSITLALQTKRDGAWKTDIGMVALPMTHKIYWADVHAAAIQDGAIAKPYLHVPEMEDEAAATSRRDALRGKRVEVVIFTKSKEDQLMQSRWILNKRLAALGALPEATFSSAKIMASMADDGGSDACILAGAALDNPWDNDAAIHIAEQAGIHTERYTIDGQPVVLLARDPNLLTALKVELQQSYQEAGKAKTPGH